MIPSLLHGGLQVAVDDVFFMRGLDAIDQLMDDGERVVEVERALEAGAFDILHDQIVGTDVIKVADVGVVQRGDGAGFAGEALGELRARDFDGDVAAQAVIVRAIHLAHATLPISARISCGPSLSPVDSGIVYSNNSAKVNWNPGSSGEVSASSPLRTVSGGAVLVQISISRTSVLMSHTSLTPALK